MRGDHDTELHAIWFDHSVEFGNYIGADLDSDDDGSEVEIAQASTSAQGQGGSAGQAQAPLEGYEDDEDAEMMDLDPHNAVMQLQTMDGVGTSQSLPTCSPIFKRSGSHLEIARSCCHRSA